MPPPLVKHGSEVTERKRAKSGRFRKKRSDTGKTRDDKAGEVQGSLQAGDAGQEGQNTPSSQMEEIKILTREVDRLKYIVANQAIKIKAYEKEKTHG